MRNWRRSIGRISRKTRSKGCSATASLNYKLGELFARAASPEMTKEFEGTDGE
jgi:hypothetical protein